jgi:polysaccharide export outer membrane protein
MSCVTNKNTRYLQKVKTGYAKVEQPEYHIQVDDELSIRLFSTNVEAVELFGGSNINANMYTYRVYPDGTIDIPFVRKIKVSELTMREAQEKIALRLKDFINGELAVKLAVNNKKFFVIGEGNRKGRYDIYKERLNVFEALAMAGDLGIDADRRNIKIIRQTPQGEKILKFDLRSRDIIDSEYYYIEPNDIIYASRPMGSFFRITSWGAFIGVVTSSLSFVLLVMQYSN